MRRVIVHRGGTDTWPLSNSWRCCFCFQVSTEVQHPPAGTWVVLLPGTMYNSSQSQGCTRNLSSQTQGKIQEGEREKAPSSHPL